MLPLLLLRLYQKNIDCSVIQTARLKTSVEFNDQKDHEENCDCTGLAISGSQCQETLYSSTPQYFIFPIPITFSILVIPILIPNGPLCSIKSPSWRHLCLDHHLSVKISTSIKSLWQHGSLTLKTSNALRQDSADFKAQLGHVAFVMQQRALTLCWYVY